MSRLVSSTRARVLTVDAVPRTLLLKEKWVGQRLTVKVTAKADGYLKSAVVTKRSVQIATG
jgi:hypothetical protein